MAGHSQFANIKHRKGAQDEKRAKVFTKLLREIVIASKVGPDPEMNAALRIAIQKARAQNVPKDRIENAVSKGSNPSEADNMIEMRYEGSVPGGISIIVEALTDNKNRTASHVRSLFTKFGGELKETGSLTFMFTKLGHIEYEGSVADADVMLEAVIDAGGEDHELIEDIHYISTNPEDFSKVRNALRESCGAEKESGIIWKPNNPISITDKERAEKLNKFIDSLDDCDDVQDIYHNFHIEIEE